MKPLVSVCVITYQQEEYIRETLDSILMQKTTFDIEIIIGEDFSKDKTREICLSYQQLYPDKIKLLPREKNLGIIANFLDTYANCSGKYVAMCEGDDYWTDDTKLQQQVDLLERRTDVSLVFHNVTVQYDYGNTESHDFLNYEKEEYGFNDVAGNWLISTPSVVFRNGIHFPEWFSKVSFADVVIFLLNAMKGKLYCIPRVMAVYRKNQGSITHTASIENNFNKLLRDYALMYDYLPWKYRFIIGRSRANLHKRLGRFQLSDSRKQEAKQNFRKHILYSAAHFKLPERFIVRTYLGLLNPFRK